MVFCTEPHSTPNIINERTEEGRVSAKKRGVKFGRKLKLTPHQQDRARQLVRDAGAVNFTILPGKDVYNRGLARIAIKGNDLGDILIVTVR